MGLLEVDSFCFLIRRMRFMRNMRSLLGVLKRHSDLFFKAFMVLLVSTSLQAAEGQGQNEHRGAVLRDYCVACHNEQLRTAGLVLETSDLDPERIEDNLETWEKVLRKVSTGQMPPAGRPRPGDADRLKFSRELTQALDQVVNASPDPGRPAVHRLNRTEYVNSIRDLLNLEVDGRALLPPDDSGFGFDNNADVLSMSPALLDRYMAAATKISRLALGDPTVSPVIARYDVPRRLRQEGRMSERLSFGSRGGFAVRHAFPLDGEYLFKVRLGRVGEYGINGLDRGDKLEIRLDRSLLKSFTVGGVEELKGLIYDNQEPIPLNRPDLLRRKIYENSADDDLEVRLQVQAGTRTVGVSFENYAGVPEGLGRVAGGPTVGSLEIRGPFNGQVPERTDSRDRIFLCYPESLGEEKICAQQILSSLARRAFRRPVSVDDVGDLLSFYHQERLGGSFESGIQVALERLLVDPEFLFRIEHDPSGLAPGSVYPLSDVELASRLSFFLWNTLPDDELLAVAEAGQLHDEKVLEKQIARMLSDAKATEMIKDFASQWLLTRNVRFSEPDRALFPSFDENLRRGLANETELLFADQFKSDQSVLNLLRADYTFLNSRLARHYGIDNVYGNHFRKVALKDSRRHGLFGHGSILTVTSYPNRTSPVLRGKWVLENILGAPPPPPPPDVPSLEEENRDSPSTVRERLERHRANPVCASCHARMDPLGFALENFDAVGRWREVDGGVKIDASARLLDGARIEGPVEFREALLGRQEEFVTTVTEKLLTYALGRGVSYGDASYIRTIVRDAAMFEYKWSSLLTGIVKSVPFQMRRVPQS